MYTPRTTNFSESLDFAVEASIIPSFTWSSVIASLFCNQLTTLGKRQIAFNTANVSSLLPNDYLITTPKTVIHTYCIFLLSPWHNN